MEQPATTNRPGVVDETSRWPKARDCSRDQPAGVLLARNVARIGIARPPRDSIAPTTSAERFGPRPPSANEAPSSASRKAIADRSRPTARDQRDPSGEAFHGKQRSELVKPEAVASSRRASAQHTLAVHDATEYGSSSSVGGGVTPDVARHEQVETRVRADLLHTRM